MEFTYTPHGVCSRQILLELDGNKVSNVRFNGGSKEQKRAWHCRQLRNGACFQNCNAQQPALHRCRKIKSRAW